MTACSKCGGDAGAECHATQTVVAAPAPSPSPSAPAGEFGELLDAFAAEVEALERQRDNAIKAGAVLAQAHDVERARAESAERARDEARAERDRLLIEIENARVKVPEHLRSSSILAGAVEQLAIAYEDRGTFLSAAEARETALRGALTKAKIYLDALMTAPVYEPARDLIVGQVLAAQQTIEAALASPRSPSDTETETSKDKE